MHNVSVWTCLGLLGAAALGSFGQLLLKFGAQKGTSKDLIARIVNIWVILGAFCVLATSILFTFFLSENELISILPLTASVYIFIPLGAALWFGEKTNSKFWIGVCCIVVGIVISLS